ncbi:MAG: methylmalonyl-CoA epimerase [Chloroflexi bacterium]|nr:methylmalonyl-CoA epimerase [Chloroflexota bacterium]
MDDATAFWQDALGLKISHTENIADQESVIAFLPVGGSEVELVEPTTETSGIARYLDKRGPGIHHVCFEVDNLQATLDRLDAQGIELINREPTTGAGGTRVAFVHPRSANGVLVELYERGIATE